MISCSHQLRVPPGVVAGFRMYAPGAPNITVVGELKYSTVATLCLPDNCPCDGDFDPGELLSSELLPSGDTSEECPRCKCRTWSSSSSIRSCIFCARVRGGASSNTHSRNDLRHYHQNDEVRYTHRAFHDLCIRRSEVRTWEQVGRAASHLSFRFRHVRQASGVWKRR